MSITASWGRMGEEEKRGVSQKLGGEAKGEGILPLRREEEKGCLRREKEGLKEELREKSLKSDVIQEQLREGEREKEREREVNP